MTFKLSNFEYSLFIVEESNFSPQKRIFLKFGIKSFPNDLSKSNKSTKEGVATIKVVLLASNSWNVLLKSKFELLFIIKCSLPAN